jgi:hypothetical protein
MPLVTGLAGLFASMHGRNPDATGAGVRIRGESVRRIPNERGAPQAILNDARLRIEGMPLAKAGESVRCILVPPPGASPSTSPR